MKKALVTGVTGQDGAYISKLLLEKGYKVFGTFRRVSTPNFWRLQTLGIDSKINLIPADLVDMGSLLEALKVSDPDEVYNLAASSYVGTSFEEAIENTEITGVAVTKFLEAVLHQNSDIKFYQASSSEMFGNSKSAKQNETTNFLPNSPYAVSKLYAHWTTNIYRESYGMFACCGVLFNHESPIRGLEFVSRKITNSVAQISLGLKDKLVLGNLKAKRDWGFAGEYMNAIHKIMQQSKPDNFVISTGESHSVSEFAKEAFDLVGLDWKKYVKTDKKFFRPYELDHLRGNARKAAKHLKWKPKITFKKLVKLMLDADLKRWNNFLDGKIFPWDAPLYPDESSLITRLSDKRKIK
jgi:GDPmannose 4,6-dehydratase|tara:strand:+ start:2177 stop:3235 length:1059 start_codon:yes stop_codon:yes gene_type:complete